MTTLELNRCRTIAKAKLFDKIVTMCHLKKHCLSVITAVSNAD